MPCIFDIKKEYRHCQYCTATICDERQLKPVKIYTTNKEVDLKKEIEEYLSTYWPNEKDLHPFLGHMAKRFFELGLKAQKEEVV